MGMKLEMDFNKQWDFISNENPFPETPRNS